jgi:hypothetical protein
VSKKRIVNTKFWDDPYIAGLSPLEKLVFVYLITNPLTNISGVYELPLRRAAFDVGIEDEEIAIVFMKFEMDGKLIYLDGWVGVVNFIKHQSTNPAIKTGIKNELAKAPRELVERLSTGGQRVPKTSDSLPDSIRNKGSPRESLPADEISTGNPQDVHKAIGTLMKKWKVGE